MNDKFKKKDNIYLSKRKDLADDIGIPNVWNVVDHFGLYTGTQTIGRSLAIFEILKKTINVPGHIVEFGSWNGSNLMYMAKVLELLSPNTHKHIYGFDSFEGLQTFSEEDKLSVEKRGEYKGNEEILLKVIDFFEFDEWVHLIKGDALKTIPEFEKNNKHLMFSLAYIDFDLYEPCKVALDFIADRIVPGGIIAFDEALLNSWPGEGKALLEFLMKEKGEFTAHNIEFARQPTLYLVKK